MAKKLVIEGTFDFPREEVFELITDPETKKAETIDVGGALEAEATRENIGKNILRLVVHSKVYGRGMDGKKDTSRTDNAVFTETWDREKFEAEWTYRMESTFADRVKVGGRKRLEAIGADRCRYLDTVRVDVDIPFLGDMIAGKVISSLERGKPKLMEWIQKKLDERKR